MILLTRLDGTPVVVNDALIVFADQTPDTVLTLSTGHKLMVKETLSQVVERAAGFRRSLSATPAAEVIGG